MFLQQLPLHEEQPVRDQLPVYTLISVLTVLVNHTADVRAESQLMRFLIGGVSEGHLIIRGAVIADQEQLWPPPYHVEGM